MPAPAIIPPITLDPSPRRGTAPEPAGAWIVSDRRKGRRFGHSDLSNPSDVLCDRAILRRPRRTRANAINFRNEIVTLLRATYYVFREFPSGQVRQASPHKELHLTRFPPGNR